MSAIFPFINTLVVGGSGFIGSALLEVLALDKGRKVTVLGRSSRPRYPLPNGVRYVQGDAANVHLMTELIAFVDEVIDLAYATVPKTSFVDPLYDVVANLPSAVNLLQIASKSNLRRYLLVSSGGAVYGNTEMLSIKENHPTNPVSPYGISKLVAEKYANFFHQMNGLPSVVVRPGNPYGVLQIGQTAQGFIGASIAAIRANRPVMVFGERGTVRDYLHVEDLALGLYATLQAGQSGVTYNLGTGLGHDNLQILRVIESLLPDSQSITVEHQAIRPFDVKHNVLDSHLVYEHTGWKAQLSLEEGLASVWHQSQLVNN